MERHNIRFDGNNYVLIPEALEPLLLLEKEYGKISSIPETMEGELKTFFFMLKGCNDNFDYDFNRFVKLLPYQKGLADDMRGLLQKKKIVEINQSNRLKWLARIMILMIPIAIVALMSWFISLFL